MACHCFKIKVDFCKNLRIHFEDLKVDSFQKFQMDMDHGTTQVYLSNVVQIRYVYHYHLFQVIPALYKYLGIS